MKLTAYLEVLLIRDFVEFYHNSPILLHDIGLY
jgi:hypothetical protein